MVKIKEIEIDGKLTKRLKKKGFTVETALGKILNKMIEDNLDSDDIKTRLEKKTQKAIKEHLCKKCRGVIVKSLSTNMMASKHGKRCGCR